MTSQFSVGTATNTSVSSFGKSQQSGGSGSALGGAFGALLNAVGSIGNDIASAADKLTSNTKPVRAGFQQVSTPNAGTGSDASTASAAASATAAATTDSGAGDAGTPPQLLRDLITSLSELNKAEASGDPLDPGLLKKVKKAIDALSNFLAAQQPMQLAAPANSTTTSDGSATPAVGSVGTTGATGAQGDSIAAARNLLTDLSAKLQTMSTDLGKSAPDLSGQLDALAKLLDPSKLSTDTLSQLGLQPADAATPADTKLQSMINGLVNGKPQPAATLQPTLSAAQLKVPDALATGGNHSLTSDGAGKPGSAGQQTVATAVSGLQTAKATTGSQGGSSAGDHSKDGGDKSAAVDAAKAAADQAQNATSTPASSATSSSAAAAAAHAPTQLAANAPAQAAQAAYASGAAAQVNLPQMAYEIAHHAQQGANHFEIKLDPAEMGRVDVKLAFDASGAVSAKLTVERPETLALLQRDAGALGQALTQAGLDGSKTSLQFSLSQNPFAGQGGGNGSNGRGNSGSSAQVSKEDVAIEAIGAASVTNIYRGTATASGLNIVV